MARRGWRVSLATALGACAIPGCLLGHRLPDAASPGPPYVAPAPPPVTAASQPAAAPAPPPPPPPPPVTPPPTQTVAAAEPARLPETPAPIKPAPLPEPPPAEIRPVSTTPARAEAPVVLALRSLLDKRPPDEALAPLERYAPSERELLGDMLWLAAHVGERDLARATPRQVAATLERLEALESALRPRAALVLDKLCFCNAIDNFGSYTPLEDGHTFHAAGPGMPGERVKVYAEVRNLTSRPAGDHFETVLEGTLEIYDGRNPHPYTYDGKNFTCTSVSRSPRRDFFVNFHFDVPPALRPGSYTLWVQVKDITPNPDGSPRPPRTARRSLDFRVVGEAR